MALCWGPWLFALASNCSDPTASTPPARDPLGQQTPQRPSRRWPAERWLDAKTPAVHSPPQAVTIDACAPVLPELPPPPTPPPAQVQLATTAQAHPSQDVFRITLFDQTSGAPVSDVVLRTTSELAFASDQAGRIHFAEPGLMGQQLFFEVLHPEYKPAETATMGGTVAPTGLVLQPTAGGAASIPLIKALRSPHEAPLQGPTPPSAALQTGQPPCVALLAWDPEEQRGVPLIPFRSPTQTVWSDSQGAVAFCYGPGPRPAHLTVGGHGYTLATGATSIELPSSPLQHAVLRIDLRRRLAASRLYRVTGQGIYTHSARFGWPTPTKQPLLNAQITGQDSADSERYRGQLFWIWGDTEALGSALGHFRAAAATSRLPEQAGLAGHLGVNLNYFVGPQGFSRPAIPPFGPQRPTWLDGLSSVPDARGRPSLFASYMKAAPDMSAVEAGMVRYNDQQQHFEPVVRSLLDSPSGRPTGNSYQVPHAGGAYVYFRGPLRIPAQAEAFSNPQTYEVYTAMASEHGAHRLDFALDGTPRYGFRTDTKPTTRADLNRAGVPASWDLNGHQRKFGQGQPLPLVGVAEVYSPYRQRFIRLGQELHGEHSNLGEIWYVQADTPMGPWVYGQQIVTHDDYTFYNVRPHPDLAPAHGRLLLFDGTFTTSFASAPVPPVPRYDYNQVMYGLDLEHPELNLPVPVYDLVDGQGLPGRFALKEDLKRRSTRPLHAPFFALPRPAPGTVAIRLRGARCGPWFLDPGPPGSSQALFYGLPADTQPAPPDTVPLYRFVHPDGRQAYSVEAAPRLPPGFTRSARPLALVWRNPIQAPLPVGDYLGELLADAGPDRCLQVPDPSEQVAVTLDARRSHGLNTSPSRFRWFVTQNGRCVQVGGAQTTLELPVGLHPIHLEVSTDHGLTDRDALWVEVRPHAATARYPQTQP